MRTEAEIREKFEKAIEKDAKNTDPYDPFGIIVSEHLDTLKWVLGGEDGTVTGPDYDY